MNHFQEYLVTEFAEDYAEGRLSRRQALKQIAAITGSLALATSILAACTAPAQQPAPTATAAAAQATRAEPAQPNPTPGAAADQPTITATLAATAAQPAPTASQEPGAPPHGTVSPDDAAIEAGALEFAGEDATLQAYLARPRAGGSFPVILVCHENRGLTDHIRDVTRRLGRAGYVALAVDLLSRQGGTAALDSGDVPGALGTMPPDQFVQDFRSGWGYLQGQPYAQSARLGMTGFCFGGGVTWRAATQMPELKAAVPFYGPHPPLEDVPNIQAAVLAIYGERDQRINQGIPAIEEAMQKHDKIFEKMIYPNADHAFFNDSGTRYNAEAAQDAWGRLLAWFGKYV